MPRDRLATTAIVACMVAAVSTLSERYEKESMDEKLTRRIRGEQFDDAIMVRLHPLATGFRILHVQAIIRVHAQQPHFLEEVGNCVVVVEDEPFLDGGVYRPLFDLSELKTKEEYDVVKRRVIETVDHGSKNDVLFFVLHHRILFQDVEQSGRDAVEEGIDHGDPSHRLARFDVEHDVHPSSEGLAFATVFTEMALDDVSIRIRVEPGL